jgi:hypothetical protein
MARQPMMKKHKAGLPLQSAMRISRIVMHGGWWHKKKVELYEAACSAILRQHIGLFLV